MTKDDFAILADAYRASERLSRKFGMEPLGAAGGAETLDFSRLWDIVRPRTMLDPFRAFMIARLARQSAALPGDVIECGSARGGGVALLALALRPIAAKKRVFFADRFDGLPEPDRRFDRSYRTGQFAAPRQDVHDFLTGLGIAGDCVVLDGDFAATLPGLRAEQRFALAHIDGDLYASTVTALREIYPRVGLGGVLVFDDVYDGSGGVLAAVWEHMAISGERLFLGPTGQCSIVKGSVAPKAAAADRIQVDTSGLSALPGYRAFLARCAATAAPPQRHAIARLSALAGVG